MYCSRNRRVDYQTSRYVSQAIPQHLLRLSSGPIPAVRVELKCAPAHPPRLPDRSNSSAPRISAWRCCVRKDSQASSRSAPTLSWDRFGPYSPVMSLVTWRTSCPKPSTQFGQAKVEEGTFTRPLLRRPSPEIVAPQHPEKPSPAFFRPQRNHLLSPLPLPYISYHFAPLSTTCGPDCR